MDYLGLQNGSDVRGIAVDTESSRANLTVEAATRIGYAFAEYLMRQKGKEQIRVALGRDPRISGEKLLDAIASGLIQAGAEVNDIMLASTPAMFMSTVLEGFEFDGSVMVTASHLPFDRNGFKFFTCDGGYEKKDIAEILKRAGELESVTYKHFELKKLEFMPVYAEYICNKVRQGANAESYMKPLDGYKIVVDAANGGGGFFANSVLVPLGADVSGSIYLEPDRHFPNHSPNPEQEEAMEQLAKATLAAKADLGIIFDPDVDRAAVVLSDGREINRNKLIAMMADIVLRDVPGSIIVTDSITSTGLAKFIAERGGVHRRFRRGYRNVINEAIRLNNEGYECLLAMETSGHGALRENYFLDDGAYIVAKLLIELARVKSQGKTLESLIDGLSEPAEATEVRFKLPVDDFKAVGKNVLDIFTERCIRSDKIVPEKENYEGIRANVPEFDGWFLLRMSLHDPVMPLNIESDSVGGVRQIAKLIYGLLDGIEGIDTESLKKLL